MSVRMCSLEQDHHGTISRGTDKENKRKKYLWRKPRKGDYMKNERQIAEMIFDVFRQTNCRAGHVVMMRVLRFGIEMKFNPVEKDKYYCVLNGLINLLYFTYESECDYLRLTEKGYNYIYDDEKVKKMLEIPWLLPQLRNVNWRKAFDNFYNNMLNAVTAKYKIEWRQFFDWINAYSTANKITAECENQITCSGEGQREKAYELFQSMLDDNARLSFYLNAQNFCEQKVLEE